MGVRRKKRMPAIVPLASMGDIAFLLIIFFILASMPKGEAEITHPESEGLTEISKNPLTVVLDEEGQCWFRDEKIVIEMLSSALKAEFQKPGQDRNVNVEIDKNQHYEKFKTVYSAVSEAGGTVVPRGVAKSGS